MAQQYRGPAPIPIGPIGVTNRGACTLLIVILAGVSLSVPGCIQVVDEEEALLFLAAASTIDALDEAFAVFGVTPSHKRHRASYGPTSVLAKQIISGAPAHLFLSANAAWADLVSETVKPLARVTIASNRLVIVVPSQSPLQPLSGKEPVILADPTCHRIAIADTLSVPVGVYARQALGNYGLWRLVRDKVVAALDARAALQLAAEAEVEAAIVYTSDAIREPLVRVVGEFDPSFHEPIRYELLLLDDSHYDAQRLFDFLASPAALSTFVSRGFANPPEGSSASPQQEFSIGQRSRLAATSTALAVH